jgi:hypothetical protein
MTAFQNQTQEPSKAREPLRIKALPLCRIPTERPFRASQKSFPFEDAILFLLRPAAMHRKFPSQWVKVFTHPLENVSVCQISGNLAHQPKDNLVQIPKQELDWAS